MYTFNADIYETILAQDETWFVTKNGYAMIINDCSLLDC